MSTLSVIAYPNQDTAASAAEAVAELQREYMVVIQDLNWVTKRKDGRLTVHHGSQLIRSRISENAFKGLLLALVVVVPIIGAIAGALLGVLGGKLNHHGIDEKWMRSLAASVPAGGSALFVLSGGSNSDAVLARMARFGGTVVKTSLAADREQLLRAALAGTRAQA